jgi:DNA-binding transcriptional MocR family regulator
LCDSYRYQSLGYYVSLLAEARGHRPLPRAQTIEDLQSPNLVRLHREALAENIGLLPGPMFSASKKTYRNCIRLSCGYSWSSRIDNALLRLGELAKAQG